MPSPKTPGSSTSISSRQRCRHRPSPKSDRLGTPKIPAIRFAQGVNFVAYTVRTFATACQVACPPVRIRPISRPSGTFTTRLPTGRLPFPLLVITTTATGLLCWWDLHPLEWQLASLHTGPHPGRTESPVISGKEVGYVRRSGISFLSLASIGGLRAGLRYFGQNTTWYLHEKRTFLFDLKSAIAYYVPG
jgi:hypothetical protein